MRSLFVAFLIANLLDLLTTYLVLQGGGFERNPILSFFFAHYPYVVGATVKLLLSALIAAYILWNATWSPRWRRIARFEIGLANVLLAIVVLNNLLAVSTQIAR